MYMSSVINASRATSFSGISRRMQQGRPRLGGHVLVAAGTASTGYRKTDSASQIISAPSVIGPIITNPTDFQTAVNTAVEVPLTTADMWEPSKWLVLRHKLPLQRRPEEGAGNLYPLEKLK